MSLCCTRCCHRSHHNQPDIPNYIDSGRIRHLVPALLPHSRCRMSMHRALCSRQSRVPVQVSWAWSCIPVNKSFDCRSSWGPARSPRNPQDTNRCNWSRHTLRRCRNHHSRGGRPARKSWGRRFGCPRGSPRNQTDRHTGRQHKCRGQRSWHMGRQGLQRIHKDWSDRWCPAHIRRNHQRIRMRKYWGLA
jgi:hypothetical protein